MERARRKTLAFCELTLPTWQSAKHHVVMAQVMDGIIAGRVKRAIVNLPPRHGKSEIYSVRGPARYLGVHPDHQLIHASYAASLSNRFSLEVRGLIRHSPIYHRLFPRTQLDPERQRVDDWMTTRKGGFRSVGIGAGISGRGAHGIIIDDAVKEGDQNSLSTLDEQFEWFISAARTRLVPGGWILIVMTRWSVADLVGRLCDLMKEDPEHADRYTVIDFPALAGERDFLGRKPGEPLWPERYDLPFLESQRALSPYLFETLYQQNPQPAVSKLFEAGDFKREVREGQWGAAVWCFDLAITDSETADYSVWGRWRFDETRRLLAVAGIERKRQEWPATKADIVKLLTEYPEDLFAFPKQTFELMAVQELRSLSSDYANRIRLVELPGDKASRAAVYADFVRTARAFVEPGEMGDLFVREHDRFPDRHDDFVDMSSVATHYFALHRAFYARFGYADEPRSPVGQGAWDKGGGWDKDKVAAYWDTILGKRA